MDYDKILVMGNGKVLEYDTPHTLLNSSGGAFLELAGPRADSLRQLL